MQCCPSCWQLCPPKLVSGVPCVVQHTLAAARAGQNDGDFLLVLRMMQPSGLWNKEIQWYLGDMCKFVENYQK